MFCEKCGMDLRNQAKTAFCPNCGNPVGKPAAEEAPEIQGGEVQGAGSAAGNPIPDSGNEAAEAKVFCPNCGAQNKGTDMFCGVCGAPLNQLQVVPSIQGNYKAPQKPKKKAFAIIGGIGAVAAVAVVALVVFAAASLLGGSSGKGDARPLLYLKDNELTTIGKKNEPLSISDRYYDSSSNGDLYTGYSAPLQYTRDGKYMFYKRNIETSCDVYYQKVGGKSSDAQKLDSDILAYSAISKDKIVYLKDSMERRLYVASIDDKEKIASDVESYAVSSDDKYVVWEERDGDEYKLYVQDLAGKNGKEKIDTVSYVVGYFEDLRTLVYRKDDALYICRDFTDKEKIASDISDVYTYNIDGKLEIYYMKSEEMGDSGYTLYDLFDDDYASTDAGMTQPDITDYQSITYEDSFWGRREVVNTSDAYYVALDAYNEKLARDSFRQSLQSQPLETAEVSIYYYVQGEEPVELVAGVETINSSIYSVSGAQSAMLYYYDFDYDSVEKMKMSNWIDAFNSGDFYTRMRENLSQGVSVQFLNKQKANVLSGIELEAMDDLSMYYNKKTDEVYVEVYRDEYDGNNTYTGRNITLYSWDYKKDGADMELIKEDVYSIGASADDGIYYFCEADKDGTSADLYRNDVKIDSDVYPGSLDTGDEEVLLYLKDIDSDGQAGTLYCYQKGNASKIADDVASGSFGVLDGRKVVYLTDYNFNKSRGELLMYNGKESAKIDTDVTCIFFGKTSCSRGALY